MSIFKQFKIEVFLNTQPIVRSNGLGAFPRQHKYIFLRLSVLLIFFYFPEAWTLQARLWVGETASSGRPSRETNLQNGSRGRDCLLFWAELLQESTGTGILIFSSREWKR